MSPANFNSKHASRRFAHGVEWLRAMVEDEAHHRGQLYWMLADFGVKTPALCGLTSEQLRNRAR